jgi:hypothetical protein
MSRHLLQPRQLVGRELTRYQIGMFTQAIVFALVAGCGVTSAAI